MHQYIAAEIEYERVCQMAEGWSAAHDDRLTECEWIALLVRHTGVAVNDGAEEAPERFRRQMVRVAALAVAAIEAYDRQHGRSAGPDLNIRGSGL